MMILKCKFVTKIQNLFGSFRLYNRKLNFSIKVNEYVEYN